MTKIAIIGGTGFTGTALAKEAAARGHEVSALSRSVPASPVEGVRYVQGSAADAASVTEGADVIIGALSPRAGSEGTLVKTYADLAQRAAASGARLIVVGGFSSLRPAPGAPRMAEGDDVPPEFAAEAREMDAVRAALEAGPENLNWTFVSPAAVYGGYAPQGAPRGTYRKGGDVALFDAEGNSAIEVADFALAILDEVEATSPTRGHISFAY